MNRKFGVEIEFIGLDTIAAAEALQRAGINAQAEGYNHTTSTRWKIIADSSCGYEAVSPPLRSRVINPRQLATNLMRNY